MFKKDAVMIRQHYLHLIYAFISVHIHDNNLGNAKIRW